ncbi:hypothetical protein HUK65_13660 [Rhodobacteraceae bacterium 2376]|uniref:Uncharacterized protein n=1 Tax=Rhabdonatronobacter sediminivivens TaxID=2743469 RepID=A0A7Z0I162_9RHOB|nr:hypothetical protein [Rhabdonatronobacter sediminivivens]NYS26036.1 hypothetical protein [Rhabdonatronobacter sediminivivens]
MDTPEIAFAFDHGQVLAGAVSGLALGVLLRNRSVATLVATGLAGCLLWFILGDPGGPTVLFEAAANRLTELATQGFLTGALLAKAAVSLVQGLSRAGGGRSRR